MKRTAFVVLLLASAVALFANGDREAMLESSWNPIEITGTVSIVDDYPVLTAGGRTQIRLRVSSSGYLSQGDPRLHFGLGAAEAVERLEIRWPGGRVQVLEDVAPNRLITLTEPSAGSGEAASSPGHPVSNPRGPASRPGKHAP